VIEYRDFTKRYGERTVVDAISLTIPAGAVVALLGPNGSGKTTSIKAAAGLIRPTAGEVLLGAARWPAHDPRARQVCSFLPQRVSFPAALTGREVVDFYRRIRQAPAAAADRVLKFASLNGAGARPVATYSGGMMQRLGLAVATLSAAEVLLLDEPTAALDPDGLCAFYGLVEERKRAGLSTFFSSHQLGDVERLADRVAVLVSGRLAGDFSEREIAARLADRGVMRVRLGARVPALLNRIREQAPLAQWFGDELIIPGPAALRPAMLDSIRSAGADIMGLTAQEGRLDELYKDLIGGGS
jgi:Cu-processing system ATP-binding protein